MKIMMKFTGQLLKEFFPPTMTKKWNTIPRTYKEIDDLRAKFEKSKRNRQT